MMDREMIKDYGLFMGKESLTITFPGKLDFAKVHSKIGESLSKYKESRIAYKDLIENIILHLGFATLESKPGFLLINQSNASSNSVAIALLIETDEHEENQLHELLFTALSYAANYYGVRFGVLAKGSRLLITDFSDMDYQNHFLEMDISLLGKDHEVCGVAFLSLIFAYINHASEASIKHKRTQSREKLRSSNIPNRRRFADNSLATELITELEKKIFSLNEGIAISEKIAYSSYEYQNEKVCEINMQTKQLKIWVPLTIDDLQDSGIPLRDVREIGHYGTGPTEIIFSNMSEIDLVFEIIEQSYRHIVGKNNAL